MNNVNPPSLLAVLLLVFYYIHIRRNARKVPLRARLQEIGRRLTGCPSERRVSMSRGGAWKAPPRFGRLSPFALALVAGLLEFVYDGGIGEGCDIPKVVLALGHTAEDAAHDLAASRLRQVGGKDDLLGPSVRANGFPDLVVELLDELFASLSVALQDHVGYDSLALILVVSPDNGGLRYGLVGDERAFDLHRADTVPRDVHHVVYSACDGVVTILILLGSVLDEVLVAEPLPIGLTVTLGVLVDRTEHAWPGPGDDQVPLSGAFDRVVVIVVDVDEDAGERPGGAARLGRRDAWERRDHDATGLRLPPRIHDGAPSAPDVLVVPLPRPRVDGLAHGTEHPQGREVVLLDRLRSLLHERPDDGRRRVVDGNPVTLDHIPVPLRAWVARRALELDGGHPVAQGSVDEVGVPRNPAYVGLAPVDVVLVDVKNPFGRGLDLREVAARGVNDALGLAGRARGVKDIEDVF